MIFLSTLSLFVNANLDTIGPINLTGGRPIVDARGVQATGAMMDRPGPDTPKRTGIWIWTNDVGHKPVPSRFRKTFELSKPVDRANLFASADTRYRLWINGRLVSRGPADTGRDYDSQAPGPWFDDVRTVTSFLRPGRNVIAAEVFPEPLVSSEGTTGHPGLKVDLRLQSNDGSEITVVTDRTWRSTGAEDLAEYRGPHGFRIDTAKEPVGWQSLPFEESAWPLSVAAQGQRKPNLISELAPPLEAVVPPIGADRVSPSVKVFGKKGGAVFSGNGAYAVRYPRILSAYLALRVEGHSGAHLLITPNEANAPGFNRRAEILLRDGDQVVELPYFDSFSTVNIEAVGVTRPVTVQEVRATFTSYPLRYAGEFQCDRSELNRMWEVCRWVTQICMQTHYLDSPHHQEPISDPGDYLIESLNAFYAFGDGSVARQDLRKYARTMEQRDFKNFHTSYMLLWLQMLLQYYDYTGDLTLIKELAPDAHKLLDRFGGYIGKNGLISEAPNYMFMDWVDIAGFEAHHPPAVIGQGYMTAFYYRALAEDGRIAELDGDGSRATHNAELEGHVKEAFNRELFVPEPVGLYRDGKPFQSTIAPHDWLPADKDIETFSTQVNSLAVAYGLAGADRSTAIMAKVLERPDMNCQPYFMHFVFSALASTPLFEKYAVTQMDRWRILPDSHSFFEMWNTGDRSHAWNATPMFQMSGRILGVVPIEPGFKVFAIKPRPSGLKWARGTVPTPYGAIRVSWKVDEFRLAVKFTVPSGAEAECGGKRFGPGSHRTVLPFGTLN